MVCVPFKVNIVCLTTNDWWTATAMLLQQYCELYQCNTMTRKLRSPNRSIDEDTILVWIPIGNLLIISTIDNDKIDAIEMNFLICVWENTSWICVASIHLILWYDPYRHCQFTHKHSNVINATNGYKCNGHYCSIRLNFTYFNLLCFFVKTELSIPKRPEFSFLFSLSIIRNSNCQWHE